MTNKHKWTRPVGIRRRVVLVRLLILLSFLIGTARTSAAADVSGAASPDRQDAAAWYEQGKQALSANRYMESIELLNRAVAAGGEDVEVMYWLGVAYWNREMGDSAISAYRRAIALDPHGQSMWSLYALENLALVYTRTDHLEESGRAYRRALARETRPEWILKIRNQLAELALTMGTLTLDESTVYNQAGEVIGGVGPGDMHTNRNFEIARHTSDPTKEERYYRLAIETDPTMFQSYFNLGLALVRQGRYDEAIEWMARSDTVWKADTDYNPNRIDKTDAHAFMALCYLERGDLVAAREHARRAMATGVQDFWARLYTLRVRVAAGEAAEALPLLEVLRIDNPEHAEVLHALSEAYAALEHDQDAHDARDRAMAVIPDDHPWMTRLHDEWGHSVQ